MSQLDSDKQNHNFNEGVSGKGKFLLEVTLTSHRFHLYLLCVYANQRRGKHVIIDLHKIFNNR